MVRFFFVFSIILQTSKKIRNNLRQKKMPSQPEKFKLTEDTLKLLKENSIDLSPEEIEKFEELVNYFGARTDADFEGNSIHHYLFEMAKFHMENAKMNTFFGMDLRQNIPNPPPLEIHVPPSCQENQDCILCENCKKSVQENNEEKGENDSNSIRILSIALCIAMIVCIFFLFWLLWNIKNDFFQIKPFQKRSEAECKFSTVISRSQVLQILNRQSELKKTFVNLFFFHKEFSDSDFFLF